MLYPLSTLDLMVYSHHGQVDHRSSLASQVTSLTLTPSPVRSTRSPAVLALPLVAVVMAMQLPHHTPIMVSRVIGLWGSPTSALRCACSRSRLPCLLR